MDATRANRLWAAALICFLLGFGFVGCSYRFKQAADCRARGGELAQGYSLEGLGYVCVRGVE